MADLIQFSDIEEMAGKNISISKFESRTGLKPAFHRGRLRLYERDEAVVAIKAYNKSVDQARSEGARKGHASRVIKIRAEALGQQHIPGTSPAEMRAERCEFNKAARDDMSKILSGLDKFHTETAASYNILLTEMARLSDEVSKVKLLLVEMGPVPKT
jgi:hypothetical protein